MSDPFNVFDPVSGNTLATWDVNGHLISGNYAAAFGNARTNWTIGTGTSTGNDLNGTVTLNSGATPPGAGAAVDITFGKAFAVAPKTVIVSGPLSAYATNVSTTGFTLTTGAASVASTQYIFFYAVIG